MAITVTIEKQEDPWMACRPWLMTINDQRAKFPMQLHLKTKKAAEEKKQAIEESSYYKSENGLM